MLHERKVYLTNDWITKKLVLRRILTNMFQARITHENYTNIILTSMQLIVNHFILYCTGVYLYFK